VDDRAVISEIIYSVVADEKDRGVEEERKYTKLKMNIGIFTRAQAKK
jgi:hypothetical protein